MADRCKEHLATYEGVFDIADDSKPGKPEIQLRVKPSAEALGIDTNELAMTVRSTFYGEEVMRLQRGRHEVKLMVRYPPEQRDSLANLREIRVRAAGAGFLNRNGEIGEVPLEELAAIDVRTRLLGHQPDRPAAVDHRHRRPRRGGRQRPADHRGPQAERPARPARGNTRASRSAGRARSARRRSRSGVWSRASSSPCSRCSSC